MPSIVSAAGEMNCTRAVAAVTRNHVAHVPRQQAITIFLDIQAARRWCAPATRHRTQVPRHRASPMPHRTPCRCAARAPARSGAGNMSKCPSTISSAAHASASTEANATTRRDAESAASSGTTTSQIAAKDSMPPVADCHRHARSPPAPATTAHARLRSGRCATGTTTAELARSARRMPQLRRGWRTADREIDRECRERREAAEQPRRHESAMARARQRVVSRRRMQ